MVCPAGRTRPSATGHSRVLVLHVVLHVEVQVEVFDGIQLPPCGPDPGSTRGRGDGHPVRSDQLVQVQAAQLGDIPNWCLERPERAQRRDVINDPPGRGMSGTSDSCGDWSTT